MMSGRERHGWWTEDRVEMLRDLWGRQGLPVREIATALGTTRMAVIGKADRLWLEHHRDASLCNPHLRGGARRRASNG